MRNRRKFWFLISINARFLTRYNKNQRKLAERIEINPKDRPRKVGSKLPPSVQQLNKLTQIQYKLANKEMYIKIYITAEVTYYVGNRY